MYRYIYIYIPPSSEVCKISDFNEKNALATWGPKTSPGAEIRSWSELDAVYYWSVTFKRKCGPGCEQKWAFSFYLNFLTWDIPQAHTFIWISFLGTCQKWATSIEFLYLGHPKCTKSHEFLYLGRAKSEPLQLNFCTWDTPQVNKIIWIPWCGHPAVKELMWIWAHVFSQIKSLRGGNTRLRGRIARAPFRRSFVSRLAIFEKALAKRLFGGM